LTPVKKTGMMTAKTCRGYIQSVRCEETFLGHTKEDSVCKECDNPTEKIRHNGFRLCCYCGFYDDAYVKDKLLFYYKTIIPAATTHHNVFLLRCGR
jgi:anaerobic ribonucleoside-triphosphate reductase